MERNGFETVICLLQSYHCSSHRLLNFKACFTNWNHWGEEVKSNDTADCLTSVKFQNWLSFCLSHYQLKVTEQKKCIGPDILPHTVPLAPSNNSLYWRLHPDCILHSAFSTLWDKMAWYNKKSVIFSFYFFQCPCFLLWNILACTNEDESFCNKMHPLVFI